MKVIVSAASRHGSTTEMASAIARVLRLRGLDADEVEPRDVVALEGYDAVVLGSAIYAGHWLQPATSLVARLAGQLTQRPVWLFSSGPVGDPATPKEASDLSGIATRTGAVEHRLFLGNLDQSELGLLERTMVRAVRAPAGDFRDWAAIEGWANQIADALVGSSAAATVLPV